MGRDLKRRAGGPSAPAASTDDLDLSRELEATSDVRVPVHRPGDLRYTPNTVWDTFPWPQAPSEAQVDAVTDAAARLIQLRDERLTDGLSLEKQYNSLREDGRNPLRALQDELDETVIEAYGFSHAEDILAQLLALNRSIAEQEDDGLTEPRRPGGNGLVNVKRTNSKIEPPVNP